MSDFLGRDVQGYRIVMHHIIQKKIRKYVLQLNQQLKQLLLVCRNRTIFGPLLFLIFINAITALNSTFRLLVHIICRWYKSLFCKGKDPNTLSNLVKHKWLDGG